MFNKGMRKMGSLKDEGEVVWYVALLNTIYEEGPRASSAGSGGGAPISPIHLVISFGSLPYSGEHVFRPASGPGRATRLVIISRLQDGSRVSNPTLRISRPRKTNKQDQSFVEWTNIHFPKARSLTSWCISESRSRVRCSDLSQPEDRCSVEKGD